MVGTIEIFRHEFADHISSKRFVVLLSFIYIIGFSMTYQALGDIRSVLQSTDGELVFIQLFTTQAGSIPSFLGFIQYFSPLIGMFLTFDAINRDLSSGTLTNVLSQPVHRDSILFGKFLAGVATISLILGSVIILINGMGIFVLSALPTFEELLRISAFALISIIYMSLWISLGLMFSIYFHREGTSALFSMLVWLFFTVFIYMIYDVTRAEIIFYSPSYVFYQCSSVIMMPRIKSLSIDSYEKTIGMLPTPLPFIESLLLILPNITILFVAMIFVFIMSYIVFMKKEIRVT